MASGVLKGLALLVRFTMRVLFLVRKHAHCVEIVSARMHTACTSGCYIMAAPAASHKLQRLFRNTAVLNCVSAYLAARSANRKLYIAAPAANRASLPQTETPTPDSVSSIAAPAALPGSYQSGSEQLKH